MSGVCARCGGEKVRCVTSAKYCLACYSKASGIGGARAAWLAVRRAVVRGELPAASTQQCVDCGKQAREYDHRDYSKPLEVQPVCRRCNLLRGPGLRNGSSLLPAALFAAGKAS